MAEQKSRNHAAERRGSWQFGLRTLLLLPLGLALCLGFFIWMYPFSWMSLPFLFLGLFVTLVARALPFMRYSVGAAVLISMLFYMIVTLMTSGCMDLSEGPRRWECTAKLRQITCALHNYHAEHGSFPPAYIADKNGRPMHSWRVLILPFLDQKRLYNKYRWDEPWNGPNNSRLAPIRTPAYECPEPPFSGTPTTSYVAVVGPGTVWPGNACTRIEEIRDGLDSTILVAEMANSGIHWMEPRDLDVTTLPATVNPQDACGISSLHRETGWRRRLSGANVSMADGSVRWLPTGTPGERLRAMLTIRGGEVVALEEDRQSPR